MVLVGSDRTWTFGLCSIYILHNTILVKSFSTEKTKEPLFMGNKVFQKSYHFEDFFWTGSGDGPVTEDLFSNDTDLDGSVVQESSFETWKTTTVFHTTTILFATVYPNLQGCSEQDCVPQISSVQTESIDFSLPIVPDIKPSPTLKISTTISSTFSGSFSGENKNETIKKPSVTPNPSLTPNFSTTKKNFHSIADSQGINGGQESESATTVFPENIHDQKYWLMTILKSDKYLPNVEVNSTEKKLSTLYRQAFNRRQEKYFGENDFRHYKEQPVKAHIFNVTQMGNDVGIIYAVTVGGKPIPAITAANDMRLMTASEVIAELGHPILSKAEPYIKVTVPLGARIKGRARDTWLLVGCVIAAIFLLMLLVGLFALLLSKKQNKKNSKSIEEEGGTSNLAFDEDAEQKVESSEKPPKKNRLKSKSLGTADESLGGTVKFKEDERKGSLTSSSCSGSSEAGLVRFRHQQMKRDRKRVEVEEKPKPKPRTRERRIQSSDIKSSKDRRTCVFSASSIISKNTFDDSVTEEYSPHLTKSPTSYLSMPSVKAFPRGTKIPEPLSKILEPTSIRHLDADSDSPREYSGHAQNRHVEVEVEQVCGTKKKFVRRKAMTRHASLEGDDPGFIGPVVWNRHCQKIYEKDTDVLNEEEYDNVNIGRMRRRFNELLDDALSMFGSRNVSPEGSEAGPSRQLDNRVHSAVLRPAGMDVEETPACRPNTTGSRRPGSANVACPKGAWETPSCSTLGRPHSDGTFLKNSPSIDKNLIIVNSDLSPTDPAIPLIAAIKSELKKFDGSPRGKNQK